MSVLLKLILLLVSLAAFTSTSTSSITNKLINKIKSKNILIKPVTNGKIACHPKCSKCNWKTGYCMQCKGNFNLYNGACIKKCVEGSFPHHGRCMCLLGNMMADRCVSPCQTGFVAIAGVCLPCHPTCKQCHQKTDKCTKCFEGYQIANQTCTLTNPCGDGYYETPDDNSTCIAHCTEGSYFSQGKCIYGRCPKGFLPNNQERSCLRDLTNRCNGFDEYIFNGKCLKQCPLGTYRGNMAFKVESTMGRCLRCPNKCKNCVNLYYCLQCKKGYINIKGMCIKTKCTPQQYEVDSYCYQSCPIGTYAQSNSKKCEKLCFQGKKYYDGWCYQVCPHGLVESEYGCKPN